jgi:hypothetical protein
MPGATLRLVAWMLGLPQNVGLRLQTGIALRRNGTTTLGELRELSDYELLRLRGVGRNRLAEVRSLVPAPEGGRR